MSHLHIASKIVLARLEKEIEKARKADLPSVFLGGSCEDNDWRQDLKKEFKDKLYFVVFYRGGEGSKRERWFMDQADREYATYDDLDKLRAYLERLAEPVKGVCISEPIKNVAKRLLL
jgi:hypothetical protein